MPASINLSEFTNQVERFKKALNALGSAMRNEECVKATEVAGTILWQAVKDRVPIDTGDLENAVDMTVIPDSTGSQAVVFIDPASPAYSYYDYVNRLVTPATSLRGLGPKSVEKQQAKGVIVGGLFFERAKNDVKNEMSDEIVRSMREALSRQARIMRSR